LTKPTFKKLVGSREVITTTRHLRCYHTVKQRWGTVCRFCACFYNVNSDDAWIQDSVVQDQDFRPPRPRLRCSRPRPDQTWYSTTSVWRKCL